MTTPDPIHLVALAGRAGSGKDTAADYLCARYGFMRAAFAAPIKTMLEAWFERIGVDHAWLHEPALKNRPIPELNGRNARHLMQTLGTELGRHHWGQDVWVHSLARELGLTNGQTPVHDRIVITDARFPNEVSWLHYVGGHVVRLRREQAGQAAWPLSEHESERLVDQLNADTELRNDGPTVHGLHALLDGLMATLGIDEREPMPQTF
jgi:hypothetical protein